MPVVYLDTSHLDLLGRTLLKNAPEFSSFVDRWQLLGCELALSWAHHHELRRYGASEDREVRYRVIQALAPIHCDFSPRPDVPNAFVTLERREILKALADLGILGGSSEQIAKYTRGFPESLCSPDELMSLRAIEDEGYGMMFSAFYDAARQSAAANSRPDGVKYERPRLSRLPNAEPSIEDKEEFLRQFAAAIDTVDLSALRNVIPDELWREAIHDLRKPLEAFFDRASSAGVVTAISENLGVDPEDPVYRRSYTDELRHAHEHRSAVIQLLRDTLKADAALVEEVAPLIGLMDCPGTWLKRKVEIQLRKASPTAEANNLFDLEHLAHLPYVDLLTADGRIVEYCRQVLRENQHPALLRVAEPVAIPSTIVALEHVLSDRFGD